MLANGSDAGADDHSSPVCHSEALRFLQRLRIWPSPDETLRFAQGDRA